MQSLLSDRDKLCQLLEQHPKLMQMLQVVLGICFIDLLFVCYQEGSCRWFFLYLLNSVQILLIFHTFLVSVIRCLVG